MGGAEIGAGLAGGTGTAYAGESGDTGGPGVGLRATGGYGKLYVLVACAGVALYEEGGAVEFGADTLA